MTVFKYELKQLKKNIIIWSLSMGGLIFLMLPTYLGFISETDDMIAEAINNNPMFEALGVSAAFVMTPLGMFSFLNSFAMTAAAIHGMSIAFSSHTKEYVNKSAEFLLTKPCSRRRVFFSKLLACTADSLIVGTVYIMGAALALLTVKGISVDWRAFLLIGKSLVLVELMFVVLGTAAGTFFPNVRTPVLFSACVMFALFCLSSMSKKIHEPLLGYFTPFAFFDPMSIAETGFYQWNYMVWYVILAGALLYVSCSAYLKKDVVFGG
nr:ABC transporter permease subunit [uncultured Clostridium sp.]